MIGTLVYMTCKLGLMIFMISMQNKIILYTYKFKTQ